ncbi:MAG TPA: ATP-binding cassette domain-containing protein [Acidobacteriota bacterium]|nr:ATP-binding cassette domain-containing protein [Acidobacteriota bacterium]HNT18263.1 ATP-binding cassette domain-containing protein [Acidobacteriota bacterium]
MAEILLKAENLTKSFPVRKGIFQLKVGEVHALLGVSFDIKEKETFGIVGESGSGKSSLGRIILRLDKPDRGSVVFEGRDFLALKGGDLRKARKNIQVVFQDPSTSLDPRMKIGRSVEEPLLIHKIGTKKERKEKVLDLLNKVGLNAEFFEKYPHQLSGGQKQRVGIARAIALNPKLIVCDEAVSALDLSVQAQILNLLEDLQKEMGISYLFIAHSLDVVEHISHRVAVMYLGRFVETGETKEIFHRPMHPYTKALMESAPVADPTVVKEKKPIEGEIPSNVNLPTGCPFHPRCPMKQAVCEKEAPKLAEHEPGHFAACHFAEKADG